MIKAIFTKGTDLSLAMSSEMALVLHHLQSCRPTKTHQAPEPPPPSRAAMAQTRTVLYFRRPSPHPARRSRGSLYKFHGQLPCLSSSISTPRSSGWFQPPYRPLRGVRAQYCQRQARPVVANTALEDYAPTTQPGKRRRSIGRCRRCSGFAEALCSIYIDQRRRPN